MPDQTLVAISQKPMQGLLARFGLLKQKFIPSDVLSRIIAISDIFASHGIDEETAAGLLKSYELHFGQQEDFHVRVNKFHDFVQGLNAKEDRQSFIDSVKNMGLLSKAELETQANETGDWSPFLKRVAQDAKSKEPSAVPA